MDPSTGSIFSEPVLFDFHDTTEHVLQNVVCKQIMYQGGTLEVTENHLVMTSQGWLPAGEILPGMVLIGVGKTEAGPNQSSYEVRKIAAVTRTGLYAHVTFSGMLIVDGILLSSYAENAVDMINYYNRTQLLSTFGGYAGFHSLQHMFTLPLRLAHRFLPASFVDNAIFKPHPGNQQRSRLKLSAPLLVQYPGIVGLQILDWWQWLQHGWQ